MSVQQELLKEIQESKRWLDNQNDDTSFGEYEKSRYYYL
jgi:hypothetical protein